MRYKYAYVDSTATTYVIACKACGGAWSTIRFDPVSARRAKADHDNRVHGVEQARADHAADQYVKRHAQDQSME